MTANNTKSVKALISMLVTVALLLQQTACMHVNKPPPLTAVHARTILVTVDMPSRAQAMASAVALNIFLADRGYYVYPPSLHAFLPDNPSDRVRMGIDMQFKVFKEVQSRYIYYTLVDLRSGETIWQYQHKPSSSHSSGGGFGGGGGNPLGFIVIGAILMVGYLVYLLVDVKTYNPGLRHYRYWQNLHNSALHFFPKLDKGPGNRTPEKRTADTLPKHQPEATEPAHPSSGGTDPLEEEE